MIDLKLLVLILMMMFSLAACGQKGKLYQPEGQASYNSSHSLWDSTLS